MSTSTFKITQVFVLKLRNRICVIGDLLSGDVSNGMWIVPSERNACFEIHSVEAVMSTENHSSIGLMFDYNDEHQYQLLKKLEGSVVLVTNKIDII